MELIKGEPESTKKCAACADTGWVSVSKDGVRRVARCACWWQLQAKQLLHKAGIPKRYERCRLSNLRTYENDELINALRKARDFSIQFPSAGKGFILLGEPGIGKTHLAVATLREIVLTKGMSGLYLDTHSLLRTLRDSCNAGTRDASSDILKQAMETDLLVVDDLGCERFTVWVEETMDLLINTRYNNERATIFTTNYIDLPNDEADERALIGRVGRRTLSRLREMCDFLSYEGPDYRAIDRESPTDEYIRQWWRAHPRRRADGSRRRAAGRGSEELPWAGGRAGN